MCGDVGKPDAASLERSRHAVYPNSRLWPAVEAACGRSHVL
jgi:hypothetical protein